MNYFPFHICVAIWLLILNIKNQTWRNLEKYLLNILYVVSFNSLYYLLCYNHLLWDFKSKLLGTHIARYIEVLCINSLLTLLYLNKLPKQFSSQVVYLTKWVVISLFIEGIAKYFGFIVFSRGWHLGWSALVYIKMYIYSVFITKRPILIMVLSLITSLFLIIWFKVPVFKSINRDMLQKHLKDKSKLIFMVVLFIAFIIGIKKRK